jgi:hypothetical protein
MTKMPSARLLRRLIDYNPDTGEMRWKARPVWMFAHGKHGPETLAAVWNGRYAGKIAGSPIGNGYWGVSIFKTKYGAHRLAWVLCNENLQHCIDHINGNKLDNRICNLRDVPHAENSKNQPLQRRSKSKSHGVRWHKRDKAWTAHIKVNGAQKHLGTFLSQQDAIAARKAAERKYGFHPNHGRAA